MKIILASKSPRRRELLERLGYNFEVLTSEKEEVLDKNLTPLENSYNISYQKGMDILNKTEGDRIIISSDTMVIKDNGILGKPKSRDDAFKMLKKLNNTSHEVITSIYVFQVINNKVTEYKDYSKALVYVDNLTDSEINNYLDTNEAYDKAGSYAIQGLFSKHIVKIEGDYYAIVGLPLNKLYNILKKII